MAITINASNIISSLQANNTFSYNKAEKKKIINNKAEDTVTNSYDFRKALRKLKDIDVSDNSTADAKSKIKKFVNSYNDFASSISGVNDSKKLTKYSKKLDSLFEDYKDELKKIGVTKESNGKLKFNDSDFNDVSSEDIKTVFGNDSDFISKAVKYTDIMKNAAYDAKISFEDIFSHKVLNFSQNNSLLAQAGGNLISYSTSLQNIDFANDDTNNFSALIEQFSNEYNNLLNTSESSELTDAQKNILSQINELTINNKSLLTNAGITVNENNFTQYSSISYNKDDMITENLSSVFNKNNSYNSSLSTLTKELFSSIVDNKKDFTINYMG